MAIISKEQILKVLSAFNPWWKTGIINPSLTKTYKRFAFYEAMKRLEQTDIKRTVVLTGTRRVGKTTIQYQMIDDKLLCQLDLKLIHTVTECGKVIHLQNL